MSDWLVTNICVVSTRPCHFLCGRGNGVTTTDQRQAADTGSGQPSASRHHRDTVPVICLKKLSADNFLHRAGAATAVSRKA
jgi:hypothetical protein